MRTDTELRSEFRSALEAVTPNAPWLGATMRKGLRTRLPTGRGSRAVLQLRMGLNVVAVLVLISLAVAAVGLYVTVHQNVGPAHPGGGRVLFPTKMVSATTGWSWVGSSELWRTTDAGANWTNVSPPSLPDRLRHYIGDLHGPVHYDDAAYLLDATHAWVAETGHSAAFGVGLYIATFRTTDGGKTWHEGASIGGVSPQLFFIDQDHGWLLLPTQDTPPADPTAILYSTDDAGLHWNYKASAPWTVGTSSMIFSSLTTGWITRGAGTLLVTHDSGATWQIQPLPVTPSAVISIYLREFFDPQHGIAYWWSASTSTTELLVTSDGGSTWIVRSLPFPDSLSLGFADANHGWAIALSATDWNAVPGVALPLYKTDDGGLTWAQVPTNVVWRSREAGVGPIDILDFVDQNNGFAIRENYQGNGYVQWLKTIDGGRTWTVVVQAAQKP